MDPKLQERIMGALTFKTGVYDDVENDPSFTQTAWIIVVIAQLLNNFGSHRDIIGTLIGTVVAVFLFYVMVVIVSWVGREVFHATVTNNELVRTLGLASIWNVLGILGFIPVLGGLIAFIVAILYFVATLIATKASLDLEWVQTLVTLIIAFFVYIVVSIIVGIILGIIGLGAAAVGGALP